MMKLEDLRPNAAVRGILPDALITVVSTTRHGDHALELVYKTPTGKVDIELLYRHDEPRLEIVEHGRPWSLDGDGALFRLVSEALRIRLAHLFDPLLAVHTSLVEPLPHQITAVYEAMLPRQPLRFLLADDPGVTPLFPERIAYTVPYQLSPAEARLYAAVTDYVREEFNRAEALANDMRARTVGFALTILQRRLASSPEAIYQSLRRQRDRLESRLRELEGLERGGRAAVLSGDLVLDAEDIEDLEEAPEGEVEAAEEKILDQATAARSIVELRAEIETLQQLEALALGVRRSGTDTKWRELASLLGEVFASTAAIGLSPESAARYEASKVSPPSPSPHQKLVIFTEHRDTLNYLEEGITTLLGRREAVVMIHGQMGREDRKAAEEAFKFDLEVRVLLATDAAGEGINLQRAHLMVNYDLPWNPNRLEQLFGRIHRIGQTEVCHLWNLVAGDTREGDVYRKLLDKLEQARVALGGQVFDVLGKLQFEGRPLRDLLIEAIRYGDRPEVRARLTTALEDALDRAHLQDLLEDRALAHDAMDASRVRRIREDMERAEARRLQPHYVESFFIAAFERLGGTVRKREPRRYEITHVPAVVRGRDRQIGLGEPVLSRYERIAFEKDLIAPHGQPLAAFVCPGHPLLDAVLDLTLERERDLLRRGTVLVDPCDPSTQPRMLFYLEHALQDATLTRPGERRVISKRVLYVELLKDGTARHIHYAPYLDFEPLGEDAPKLEEILARPECAWIERELERRALSYAVSKVVPEHLAEVRGPRLELIAKTKAAVHERLTKEMAHWDHRAEKLKLDEQAGKPNARLNWEEARKRADLLDKRMKKRFEELELEAQISALPPVVLGGQEGIEGNWCIDCRRTNAF